MNETSQGARFDEAKLKDLTGGDTLTARFLHQEFFDFRPTHRLVIRGNHKPAINGTDDGIWRRLRLIPFTVSIPPAEQDHDLLRKLESELSGFSTGAPGLPRMATRRAQAAGYRHGSGQGVPGGERYPGAIHRRMLHGATASSSEGQHPVQALPGIRGASRRTLDGAEGFPRRDRAPGFRYKRERTGTRIYEGLELANVRNDDA